MAHSTNIISEVKLPNGITYQIHDAQAVHSAADLGLGQALVFKGTVATLTDLQAIDVAEEKIGNVYLVTATNQEYVVVQEGTNAAARKFEPLGNVHDAAASDHIHNVTSSGNADLAVSAETSSQVVTSVTATAATLALPTGITQASYEPTLLESQDDDNVGVVTSVAVGTKATVIKELNTENITIPGYSNQTVVTGLGTPSTANVNSGFSSTSATVKVVKTDGTAPSWAFSVANGILTISGGNGSAPVTENKTVVTSATASTTSVVTGYSSVATTSVMKHGTDTTKTVATGTKSTADVAISVTPTTKYIGIKQVQNAALTTTNKTYVSTVTSGKATVGVSGNATGGITVTGTTSQPVKAS